MFINLLIRIVAQFSKLINFSNCYFCSVHVSSIKMKIYKTKQMRMICCKTCYDRVVHNQQAKVLCFKIKDKVVHWTQNKEYAPTGQYRDLNEKPNLGIIK